MKWIDNFRRIQSFILGKGKLKENSLYDAFMKDIGLMHGIVKTDIVYYLGWAISTDNGSNINYSGTLEILNFVNENKGDVLKNNLGYYLIRKQGGDGFRLIVIIDYYDFGRRNEVLHDQMIENNIENLGIYQISPGP